MMYGSWDIRHNGQSFFVILTLLTTQKIKILKKWKKGLHISRSYDVWFLKYEVRRTEFFVILDHFLSFDPPNNPQNQNFQKKKESPGDIIILHLCTTNDDYMMYGSWDIKCNRHNFLSFWAMFCSFTPPTTWKFLKKWKYLEISLFYTCLPQMTIICMVSEKWNMTGVMSCHFGLFFAFYTLPLEILSF